MSLLKGDRVLAALTVTRGIGSMAYYVYAPFFGVWLIREQSLPAAESGTVVGAFILTTRAGSILLPALVRLLGERGAVILSYAATVCLFWGMYSPGSGYPLFAWYVLSGLLGFAFSGATLALKSFVAERVGEDKRVGAFSFLNLAVNIGAALGPVVGGWVVTKDASILPLVASGLQILSVFVAFSLPGGRFELKGSRARPVGGWRPSRRFLGFVGASSLTWIAYVQLFNVFPVYAEGHLDERVIGALFSVNAAMIILLQVPAGRALQRAWQDKSSRLFGVHPLLLLANLCLALSMFLFVAARSWLWPLVFAGVILFTLSELLWSPMYDTGVAHLRDGMNAAAAFGIVGVAWGMAEALGSSLGIALTGGSAAFSAFLLGSAAALVAGITVYSFRVLRPGKSLVSPEASAGDGRKN